MGIEKAKYIAAVCIYGTVGLLFHYISLPSELVVLCRGVLGTATILAVMAARGRRFHRDAIRKNLPVPVLSGALLGFNWVFLFAAYRATTPWRACATTWRPSSSSPSRPLRSGNACLGRRSPAWRRPFWGSCWCPAPRRAGERRST